jgi:hypothetical protein
MTVFMLLGRLLAENLCSCICAEVRAKHTEPARAGTQAF